MRAERLGAPVAYHREEIFLGFQRGERGGVVLAGRGGVNRDDAAASSVCAMP